MAKFEEASKRLFARTFVCRKCKKKIRTEPIKVIQKSYVCKNCGCKAFRPIKKQK